MIGQSDLGRVTAMLDRIAGSLDAAGLPITLGIQLPAIVMVGDQSTGKSSTLEGVVGFPIFPTGYSRVTKAATRVSLQHIANDELLKKFCKKELPPHVTCSRDGSYFRLSVKDSTTHSVVDLSGDVAFNKKISREIAFLKWQYIASHGNDTGYEQLSHAVRQIMDQFANEVRGGYFRTPVIKGVEDKRYVQIEVAGTSVIDLILIDLPGLIQVPGHGDPPDVVSRIDKLVDSYLEDDSVILVTAAATTLSLQAVKALKTLHEKKKLGDSIGVLTMANMLRSDYSVKHVIELLDGTNTDVMPDMDYRPMHGFVMVAHRDSRRTVNNKPSVYTLGEAAAVEQEWIQDYLPPRLRASNGQCALIGKLSDLLNSFLREKWASGAVRQIEKAAENVQEWLDKLGVPVPDGQRPRKQFLEKVVSQALDKMTYVGEKGNWHRVVERNLPPHYPECRYPPVPKHCSPREHFYNCQAAFPTTSPTASSPETIDSIMYLSRDLARFHEGVKDCVGDAVKAVFLDQNLKAGVGHVADTLLRAGGVELPLKYDRFPNLRNRIILSWTDKIKSQADHLRNRLLDDIVETELSHFSRKWAEPGFVWDPPAGIAKLSGHVRRSHPLYDANSRKELFYQLWKLFNLELSNVLYAAYPSLITDDDVDFLLQEDKDSRSKRVSWNNVQSDLRNAAKEITEMSKRSKKSGAYRLSSSAARGGEL